MLDKLENGMDGLVKCLNEHVGDNLLCLWDVLSKRFEEGKF